MKKIIILLLTCILLTGCSAPKETYEVKNINIEELQTLVAEEETFLLVVSQTFCAACNEYKTSLSDIANDIKKQIYVIEYDELNEDEVNELVDIVIEIYLTPTSYAFIDGELNDYEEEILTLDQVKELFNK